MRTGQLQPSYGENKEELPPNDMPEPRGIAFTIRAFVDSDHAGDVSTRRSRTGFIIMLNSQRNRLVLKRVPLDQNS